MEKRINTSPFGTVPVVVFQRLHVDTGEAISLHAIILESAADARGKADWIASQPDFALLGMTDATFASAARQHEQATPGARTEYGKRLDGILARVASRLGDKPVVLYSAYRTRDDLPIDNLDEIAIHGKVQFHAEHDPFWGHGNHYTSAIIDSPTWLDVAVLGNQMIKTTRDFHHQFLEGVRVVNECNGVKHAKFLMGS
jgi:hypothetical protein